MKNNKKDIIICLSILIISCSFITCGMLQIVFKAQPEVKVALETAGISQFNFALATYGKQLPEDKVEIYNAMVKKENQIDYSEDNLGSYLNMWLTVLRLALVITIIISIIYFTIRNKINRKRKMKQDALLNKKYMEKYSLNGNEIKVKCINGDISNNQIINKLLILWRKNDAIYFINNDYYNDFGLFKINYNDIICYSRYGDFYTSTNIEGGGSSMGMAFLGQLFGGDAGAIIASRNPITSETIVHDKRETLVFIKDNNEEKYIFFDPNFYDILMHTFPDKEIDIISKKGKTSGNNNANNNDKIEKIRKIGELKDNGYIDETEFIKLKNELNI